MGTPPTYGIRHMTAYTPGTNTTNTERSFAGRLATHNEVQQAVNELAANVTAPATLSGSARYPRIGSGDGFFAYRFPCPTISACTTASNWT